MMRHSSLNGFHHYLSMQMLNEYADVVLVCEQGI